MNNDKIVAQSKAAYTQWKEQWRVQAKEHSQFKMKPFTDLHLSGIGKAILCVANGYSFEENIETIKQYKDKIDIICCDKTLGHLIDNGISPKYVMICDANVDYEKYMKPWEDKLSNSIALINVCANPKWAQNGNWKDKYFFVNKDVLKSEIEFSKISGCQNQIPAGTNVSNAMVIMLTQCDNEGRKNYFGYDKILLIGYDYSWRPDGKYYSFNDQGDGKNKYMRHIYVTTTDGSWAYTSGNLAFSADWFQTYVKTFNLPVVQCTGKSILHGLKISNLKDQIKYFYKPEDSKKLKDNLKMLDLLIKQKREIEKTISGIEKDHWHSFLCSV